MIASNPTESPRRTYESIDTPEQVPLYDLVPIRGPSKRSWPRIEECSGATLGESSPSSRRSIPWSSTGYRTHRSAGTRSSISQAVLPATAPMASPPKVPARLARTLRLFTASWNTSDPDERERLVRATCSPRLEVSSPYGRLRGIRAQVDSIAEVRTQFPRMRTRGTVLGYHHGLLLSAWWTEFGGARRPLTGIDCYAFDARGLVLRVLSFSPVRRQTGRARPTQRPAQRTSRGRD